MTVGVDARLREQDSREGRVADNRPNISRDKRAFPELVLSLW